MAAHATGKMIKRCKAKVKQLDSAPEEENHMKERTLVKKTKGMVVLNPEVFMVGGWEKNIAYITYMPKP